MFPEHREQKRHNVTPVFKKAASGKNSPGGIELYQPEAIALQNLPVEVGWSEFNHIITGGV